VESRYHAAAKHWAKAIDIDRRLWGFFSDNVDYGLQLAHDLVASGDARQALATVDALRRLPPAGDDPRVDLAEAGAAQALSDLPRQRAAATRALARVEWEAGALDQAAAGARQAAQAFHAQHRGDSEASALALVADALAATDTTQARTAVEQAKALTGATRNRAVRLAVAITAARLRARAGHVEEASGELDRAAALTASR
jgi:hypothetical protein